MGIYWNHVLDICIYLGAITVIVGLLLIKYSDNKDIKKKQADIEVTLENLTKKSTNRLVLRLQNRVVQLTNENQVLKKENRLLHKQINNQKYRHRHFPRLRHGNVKNGG